MLGGLPARKAAAAEKGKLAGKAAAETVAAVKATAEKAAAEKAAVAEKVVAGKAAAEEAAPEGPSSLRRLLLRPLPR